MGSEMCIRDRMKTDPYLMDLFYDYPVLWVHDYADVRIELLLDNYHLYKEAQEMDLTPLTLPNFFDKIINTYAGANG